MKLVFTYLPYAEVAGLWMGEHQSADGSMGTHGSIFSELDAYLLHIQQLVYEEVHRLVWQTGISYCRTDALELLLMKLFYGEVLVRCIAPCLTSHILVQFLSASFCQTVGQRLYQQSLISICLLAARLMYRCSKESYGIWYPAA